MKLRNPVSLKNGFSALMTFAENAATRSSWRKYPASRNIQKLDLLDFNTGCRIDEFGQTTGNIWVTLAGIRHLRPPFNVKPTKTNDLLFSARSSYRILRGGCSRQLLVYADHPGAIPNR